MSLLLGTLVACVLQVTLVLVLSGVIALILDWLSMPGRWNGSQLPEPLDDLSYDLVCDGWWIDDFWTDTDGGLAYRTRQGRLQFLLTAELIEGDERRPRDLQVWALQDGAQL